jgi:hypothetical protein
MVKMSLDDSTTFSEQFENYIRDNPQYQSSNNHEEFRKFIWLKENIHTNPKERTDEDKRKIRQIQRYLKKFYNRLDWYENKVEELNRKYYGLKGFLDEYVKISDLIETDEDYQDLHNLLKTLQERKFRRRWKDDQEDRIRVLKEK